MRKSVEAPLKNGAIAIGEFKKTESGWSLHKFSVGGVMKFVYKNSEVTPEIDALIEAFRKKNVVEEGLTKVKTGFEGVKIPLH